VNVRKAFRHLKSAVWAVTARREALPNTSPFRKRTCAPGVRYKFYLFFSPPAGGQVRYLNGENLIFLWPQSPFGHLPSASPPSHLSRRVLA